MKPPFSSLRYRTGRLSQRLLQRVEKVLLTNFSRSNVVASIYCIVCSRKYRREQVAVIEGRARYEQLREVPAEGFALLRRNTHRIEKGLLMRPRREVFAREYILETVHCYCKAISQIHKQPLSAELKWSRDVLHKFFEVTNSDPILDQARRLFGQSSSSCETDDVSYIPYRRHISERPAVSIEDFEKLAFYRRSVRWFLDLPVEREKIDRALSVASQAPSACNRQPFQFRIFDDPALVKRIAKIPMGTAGYAENIPTFIVIIGQQRNFFDERDRHLIYIDGSLAAMSFLFAAEVLGLSTCCINWPDIETKEKEMAEAIGLAPDERPIMCLAVGYPDPEGLVAYSQKKGLEQLRTYNEVRAT